jgi:hypothetical protein
MNNFEEKFFIKYIPEEEELLWIIHKHFSVIFLRLFFWLSLAILPAFIYYYSETLKNFMDFYYLEWYLLVIYVKIIYDTFDWYNDVWMITNNWIIDLKWSLLKKKVDSVKFENIEWLWVEQNWLIDTILKKWDLVIHKIWDDRFILEDVFKPFKWVELIEEISAYHEDNNEEANITEERFNMLINTLGWLMEWVVNKNWDSKLNNKKDEILEIENKIKKLKKNNWTIDLR